MINIAIVDNEKSVLENISGILSDMRGESDDIHIDTYEKAKDFLAAFETVRYQILISDVDMPEMNGIEMGKKARDCDPNIYIIFLTAYVEYAIESYRMEAYQYILKEDVEERLPEIIKRLIGIVRNHSVKYCYIGSDTHRIKMCQDDIIHIRKTKGTKYVSFCTTEGEIRERSSIEKVLEKLGREEFIVVERGSVVNLRHIMKVRDNVIYLSNGDAVEASHARIKKVKENIRKYWEER
mgnify:CR=1 FL=1